MIQITDLNAELSVLMTALYLPEAAAIVFENLSDVHFHDSKSVEIFTVMKIFYDKSIPLDRQEIANALRGRENYNQLMQFLVSGSASGSVAHLNDNVAKLKQCHKNYHMISLAKQLLNAPTDKNIDDLYQLVNSSIEEIKPSETLLPKQIIDSEFMGFKDCEKFVEAGWLAKKEGRKFFNGISTGYKQLDLHAGGMGYGDYIIIGGRPGSGKTTFAINLMKNAMDQGAKVGFISLEMSADQVILKLVSRATGIPYRTFVTGDYRSELDIEQIKSYLKILRTDQMYIDASPIGNLTSVLSKIRRMKRLYDIDIVCIDYLGLMSTSEKNQTTMDKLTQISEGIRQLLKELKIAGLILCQLRKTAAVDKEPNSEDIRDCDKPVQDAHQIILLNRKDDEFTGRSFVRAHLTKVRVGHTGYVDFDFDGAYFQERRPLEDLQKERKASETANRYAFFEES